MHDLAYTRANAALINAAPSRHRAGARHGGVRHRRRAQQYADAAHVLHHPAAVRDAVRHHVVRGHDPAPAVCVARAASGAICVGGAVHGGGGVVVHDHQSVRVCVRHGEVRASCQAWGVRRDVGLRAVVLGVDVLPDGAAAGAAVCTLQHCRGNVQARPALC